MPPKRRNILGRLLIWRTRHISQDQFILILSVLVGLISGFVAVVLKNATHIIQELVARESALPIYNNPYYFVFPIIGIIITIIIKKVIGKKIGEGIPTTLLAISRKNGILAPYRMFASIITSIFTVGFGGSVGLEGPTVSTGSAIGSNIGRLMHLDYKSRILLISCASAGAIASIFNAPIAGMIFTIEVFSLDLTFSSLIPLLLASASGAITSIFIQGNDYLFHFKYVDPFQVSDLPFYLLLGVLTAFISVYFSWIYFKVDEIFSKFKHTYSKILIGGGLLGLLVFIFPPLYGEGYETINNLLNGNFEHLARNSFFEGLIDHEYVILILLAGIVIFKAFATSFTLSAGGVGGMFAPSLFLGASFGYVFARVINDLNIVSISTSNYTLAGMTGLMAGVLQAPLTAIFMIAEVTAGYELFLPLMLVSATSFLVTRHFMPHSIYTMQLAKKGDLLTHNKDQAILTLLNIEKVIEKDFTQISPEMSLRKLLTVVSTSRRNLFPVVDANHDLVGILTLDDVRGIIFDDALYDLICVDELMYPPPATIQIDEEMNSVMEKFQSTGAWNLPVVNKGKYIGFISKSKLFNVYRKMLIDFTG